MFRFKFSYKNGKAFHMQSPYLETPISWQLKVNINIKGNINIHRTYINKWKFCMIRDNVNTAPVLLAPNLCGQFHYLCIYYLRAQGNNSYPLYLIKEYSEKYYLKMEKTCFRIIIVEQGLM